MPPAPSDPHESLLRRRYAPLLLLLLVPLLLLAPFSGLAKDREVRMREASDSLPDRQVLLLGASDEELAPAVRRLRGLGFKLGLGSGRDADGTASWIHTLRYLEDERGPHFPTVCSDGGGPGWWHPVALEPGQCPGTSNDAGWDACASRVCEDVLARQYACELLPTERPKAIRKRALPHACRPRFNRTLLQVVHPLRSTTLAVRAHCPGGRADASPAHVPRLSLLRSLLPSVPWHQYPSCGAQFAAYWLEHVTSVRAFVDDYYAGEDAEACDLAELAGFVGESLDVGPGEIAPPAHWRAADRQCEALAAKGKGGGELFSDPQAPGAAARAAHEGTGLLPDGTPSPAGGAKGLTYEDILRIGGPQAHDLVEELRDMAMELGYDEGEDFADLALDDALGMGEETDRGLGA